MRKVLQALPKTESLAQTEKNYRKLESFIFEKYIPMQ